MRKDIDEHLERLETAMCDLPYESAAYHIIKLFMHVRKPSDDLKEKFNAWIISPHNETEKELALQKKLLKIIEEEIQKEEKHSGPYAEQSL